MNKLVNLFCNHIIVTPGKLENNPLAGLMNIEQSDRRENAPYNIHNLEELFRDDGSLSVIVIDLPSSCISQNVSFRNLYFPNTNAPVVSCACQILAIG